MGTHPISLLPALHPELLGSDSWSTQWVVIKVGTDGLGRKDSAVCATGEGSED